MGFAIQMGITIAGAEKYSPVEFMRRTGEGLRRIAFNYRAVMVAGGLTPVNTGALRTSINASFNPARQEAVVGTPLVYAVVMEKSRRAGKRMPPIDAIELWVKRKLSPKAPPLKIRGKRLAAIRAAGERRREELAQVRFGFREKLNRQQRHLRGIAFVIARSIARKGISIPLKHDQKGGMFRRTFERTRTQFGSWFKLGFLAARTA